MSDTRLLLPFEFSEDEEKYRHSLVIRKTKSNSPLIKESRTNPELLAKDRSKSPVLSSIENDSLVEAEISETETENYLNQHTSNIRKEKENLYFVDDHFSESETFDSSGLSFTRYEADEIFSSKSRQSIYPNSDILLNDFILSFESIVIKHKLSDKAVTDICKFMHLILPQPNIIPSNCKSLTKYFYNSKDINLFHTCSSCKELKNFDGFNGEIKNEVKCTKCENLIDQFITIDVESQLKNILTRKRIKEIKKKLDNISSSNVYSGVMNGKIYQDKI
ncbi:unnamed protein product, partial [Brachionus calyciflorus]